MYFVRINVVLWLCSLSVKQLTFAAVEHCSMHIINKCFRRKCEHALLHRGGLDVTVGREVRVIYGDECKLV